MQVCTKRKHGSKEEAIYFQVAKNLQLGENRPFRVYRCGRCGCYHVTFQPHADALDKEPKLIFYKLHQSENEKPKLILYERKVK